MSNKKDGKNMLDMLERMGMVRKTAENPADRREAESAFTGGDFGVPEQPQPQPGPVLYENQNADVNYMTEPMSYDSGGGIVNSASMNDRDYWGDASAVPAPEISPDMADPRVPDTDQYCEIEELYTRFGMRLKGTDTIYVIEDYLKTLPDSLPGDLKKTIVLNIIAASEFDFEKLLNDGVNRVTRLSDYAGQFAGRSEGMINGYTSEIESLERQIAALNDLITERRNMHKKQFLAIENETQRLREILDFITK